MTSSLNSGNDFEIPLDSIYDSSVPEYSKQPKSSFISSRKKIKTLKSNFLCWFSFNKRKKSGISSPKPRELPPVPEIADELPFRFGIVDEHPTPGTAYFPDEDDDEDPQPNNNNNSQPLDIASTIQKVKDYSWYWGPISGEVAERLLEKEPDGSFLVRDSSASDYIFSLTVKLNKAVRHVRIEHGQGNFSFGSSTRFKSSTLSDFIENAVQHSRSGRYLFFLHRKPELGPMRVQLLHPVSRLRVVQSLQHYSRFIILKHISRDLLHKLPVPKRIQEYLNTPFYYSESIREKQ